MDGRDELGDMPREVLETMTRHTKSGYAERTRENAVTSDGLILMTRTGRIETPGTKLTARIAREHNLPQITIDPSQCGDPWERFRPVGEWVDKLVPLDPGRDQVRLMIAGPRASGWPSGFRLARELVWALATWRQGLR